METLVQAPAWVKERREHASRRFAEVGFPTTRNEDWRFTNIAPIAEAKFAPAQGVFKQAAALIASVNVAGRRAAGDREWRVRRGVVGSEHACQRAFASPAFVTERATVPTVSSSTSRKCSTSTRIRSRR